jgi:hypothetical protein
MITKYRYPFSGKSFTTFTPIKAPRAIPGIISTSNVNECKVMVFQINMWKGILKRFTIKKNHAAVPM